MSKGIRLAAVVNDTHAGSTGGLLPPDFETHAGNVVRQNPVQRWLWECWTDLTQTWLPSVVGNDPFLFIVNGDATEGKHHGTTEIVTPEMKDHIDAAIEILHPLAKRAAATIVTEGTECHTGVTEHSIAKAIGATKDPETNRYAWERADIEIAGTRVVMQHHITTTARPYLEASALSIHLGVEVQEAARNGEKIPKVLGCAHRHRYGSYSDGYGLCVVGPAWQMVTRHGRKVVPSARTQPGMYVLDWRGRPDNSVPLVHHRGYKMPPRKRMAF